jgi:hypothetical protein
MSTQKIRKIGGKEYALHGVFAFPDIVDNAKDRLKYQAFTGNRLVSFRTIKKEVHHVTYYELYYRFHADVKKRRKK